MTFFQFINTRIKSFAYAITGLAKFFRAEPNAWLHLIATALVIAAGFYFHVTATESISLSIVIGFVWAAEAFNTVIERIMDLLAPQPDPRVAFIKDLAAGAVLLSAITALVTGGIIFIPKLF